jgi:hypothetical protein
MSFDFASHDLISALVIESGLRRVDCVCLLGEIVLARTAASYADLAGTAGIGGG